MKNGSTLTSKSFEKAPEKVSKRYEKGVKKVSKRHQKGIKKVSKMAPRDRHQKMAPGNWHQKKKKKEPESEEQWFLRLFQVLFKNPLMHISPQTGQWL